MPGDQILPTMPLEGHCRQRHSYEIPTPGDKRTKGKPPASQSSISKRRHRLSTAGARGYRQGFRLEQAVHRPRDISDVIHAIGDSVESAHIQAVVKRKLKDGLDLFVGQGRRKNATNMKISVN